MLKSGLYAFEWRDSAYNGNEFLSFIERLIEKLAIDGHQNMTFNMDNVAFHKVATIPNAIRAAGHSILFLPPYSPQLNPIEELFSK